MTLTNEEREQVFGMHIGSKAQYKNEFGTFKEVVGWQTLQRIALNGNGHDTIKLILKPLSEISDDDKKQLCVILAVGDCISLDFFSFPDSHIVANYTGLRDCHKYFAVDELPYQAADFLRSKSYALPYKQQDLFTLGIAVKPNEV